MKSAFCIEVLSLIVLLVTPAVAQLESARALHGLGEVTVGIIPLEQFPAYSVRISLQLRQSACLARNLVICEPAITWEDTATTRTVDVSELASLQRDVFALVDRFAAAYLKQNLRQ